MGSSLCNQSIIWHIKVFTAQSYLKNKTVFILDLEVKIAVKKMAGMSFCTKVEKREILEGKSNNVAYIFIFFYNRYLGSFLSVKWLGSGVDHPPPANARLRMVRAISVLPICAFMTCCRVNCTH